MSFFKVLLASVLGFFTSLFLIALLSIAVIGALIAGLDHESEPVVASGTVLEIDLTKAYPEYSSVESFDDLAGEGAVTLREVVAAIDAARDDSRIVGVRLKVTGSPGSWASAEELRRAIAAFDATDKFVIATVGERGVAEGGYYVASAADSVLIVPGAHVEMNGVAAVLPFVKPAMDRLGIRAQVVRAGTFKSAIEPFTLDSASSETRMVTRELVDETFGRFRAAVSEARGITPVRLNSLLSTKGLMTAHEAVEAGLVDAVMYEDQIDSLLRARASEQSDKRFKVLEIGEYAKTINSGGGAEQVAIVYAVGEIRAGESGASASPLSDGESLGNETFAEAMKSARESESVKAVVVRIESPGGEAGPSEAMWREIKLTAAEKPVIASMGSVAASGGYFLAAACDTIVAEANTITGSIGVFGLWFTAEEFMRETVGINLQVIRSDSLADMMSVLREPTDLERAILQRSVDSTYQKFLRIVAEGRGMTLAQADAVGQGRVYTGIRAKQLNLVDEIGGLGRAIEIASARAGLEPDAFGLRILPVRKSFIESIVEAFTQSSTSVFAGHRGLREMVSREIKQRSGVQMLGPIVRVGME